MNNLDYFKFLDDLGLEYSTVLSWGVGHDPAGIYAKNGMDIMLFHARNFGTLQAAISRQPST